MTKLKKKNELEKKIDVNNKENEEMKLNLNDIQNNYDIINSKYKFGIKEKKNIWK